MQAVTSDQDKNNFAVPPNFSDEAHRLKKSLFYL